MKHWNRGSDDADIQNQVGSPHASVSNRLDKNLTRIARTALRREMQISGSPNRVTAYAREIVRQLPNSALLDESEVVAHVVGRLRCIVQSGEAARSLSSEDRRDTVVRPSRHTVLAH